ncbi:hypothetical protein EV193_103615 [Herbihabitans rhizosphaerae]|uniref:PPE family protein n=1 Tax=Herbihabitans rhizosphaerae TaxID=1872711 RepID=A0A4V2ETJ5_9PSEU|nr:hypothetical protein [Herbihabitans rhizosphaerae]RZS41293.1 hypothetical protein EV193_103615 [Herbihabitans rhizosphaerae]
MSPTSRPGANEHGIYVSQAKVASSETLNREASQAAKSREVASAGQFRLDYLNAEKNMLANGKGLRPVSLPGSLYQSRAHADLERMVRDGDPAAVQGTADMWMEIGGAFLELQQAISDSVGKSKAGWRGQAAEKAHQGMANFANWAGPAGESAMLAGKTAQAQGEALELARRNMPPAPASPIDPNKVNAELRAMPIEQANALAPKMQAEFDRQKAEHQRAVDVVSGFDSALGGSSVPMFAPPPRLAAGGGGSVPPGGSGTTPPGGGSRAGIPQVRDGGGGTTGRPGDGGGSTVAPPPGTGDHGAPPPGSAAPPGGGSPVTRPGPGAGWPGGTSPEWHDPSLGGGQDIGRGPSQGGPGQGLGQGLGQGSGPGGGMMPPLGGGFVPGGASGDSGTRGRSGFGPLGSGGTPAPGSRAGGMGGYGGEHATGRGGYGGAASGRGGAAGMGGMPFGGGAGSRGEDDQEHRRPKWLVEGDPDSLFDTDQVTAPPVIGLD